MQRELAERKVKIRSESYKKEAKGQGRPKEDEELTINNLKLLNIRYDHIIFDAGSGARILINDTKPSGYKTAHSFCTVRNFGIYTDDLNFFMEI